MNASEPGNYRDGRIGFLRVVDELVERVEVYRREGHAETRRWRPINRACRPRRRYPFEQRSFGVWRPEENNRECRFLKELEVKKQFFCE